MFLSALLQIALIQLLVMEETTVDSDEDSEDSETEFISTVTSYIDSQHLNKKGVDLFFKTIQKIQHYISTHPKDALPTSFHTYHVPQSVVNHESGHYVSLLKFAGKWFYQDGFHHGFPIDQGSQFPYHLDKPNTTPEFWCFFALQM